jgi:hypothetical protein
VPATDLHLIVGANDGECLAATPAEFEAVCARLQPLVEQLLGSGAVERRQSIDGHAHVCRCAELESQSPEADFGKMLRQVYWRAD